MIPLVFTLKIDGVLTDLDTLPLLSSPSGTFGVKRLDTDATVVPNDTVMPRESVGRYVYNLGEPAPGLDYEYWVEWVYQGATNRTKFVIAQTGVGSGGPPVDPIPAEGRYTNSNRMYIKFGQENVLTWARYSDAESAAQAQERIALAIDIAEDFIDDALRGRWSYNVPFTEPKIPQAIRDIATTLAGVELYEARGLEDVEDGQPTHRLTMLKRFALRKLTQVQQGVLALDAPGSHVKSYPQIIDDSDDTVVIYDACYGTGDC